MDNENINNVYAKYSQEIWLLIDAHSGTEIENKLYEMFLAAYKLGRSVKSSPNVPDSTI